MGSLYAGGTVITAPGTWNPADPNPFGASAGQTLHADHVYAQYKIPAGSKKALPLVMWHGCLSPSWETTPDGREGYESIFVRRGFSTYVIDWPRTGRSGKSSVGATINPAYSENASWNAWRLGIWPNFFPGSQFPHDPASLDHFFREGGTNNGPGNNTVAVDAVSALFDKTGPAILLTHSASGVLGFLTAIKNPKVKAVVAYEPNDGPFPTGEVPAPIPNAAGALMSFQEVSQADFNKLTKIPIIIFFSDFIPTSPDATNIARDNWRVRLAGVRLFVKTINKHGGDAQLVHYPEIGIRGNSHFSFTDKNNIQIADLLSDWLRRKKLDKEKNGH
jgi:pimeloyl-ACP methyl ester carboxylesterase